MNILVVQDEEKVLSDLVLELKKNGNSIESVFKLGKGLEKFYEGDFDIILTELEIDGLSGIILCEKIRKIDKNIGIIFLTKHIKEDNQESKLKAFEALADDYITIPFLYPELLARINALYRRISLARNPNLHLITVGNITLDSIKRQIIKEGQIIQFTDKEFSVLYFLAKHKNHPMTRGQIRDSIWGVGKKIGIVDVYMKKIRTKLNDKNSEILKTVRRFGYLLEDIKENL